MDLSQGIPTSLPFAPKKQEKRPVRRKKRSLYPPLPLLQKQTTTELVGLFQRRNWDQQRDVIEEVVRRGSTSIPLLKSALQQKRPRTRLLAAIALAHLKHPAGLPVLLEMAEQFHDQGGLLILGGFLAYGIRAEAPLCEVLKKTKHPQLFLQAFGMLQVSRCYRILLRFLASPDEQIQQSAFNALQRMPHNIQRSLILRSLRKPRQTTEFYANLLRMLPNFPNNQTIATLMFFRKHKNPSLRFLARILLEDIAAQAYKHAPKWIPRPPRRPVDPLWRLWQQQAAKGMSHYVRMRTPAPLDKIVTPVPSERSWVLYRLIHPLFGVGWMPLFIYCDQWKQPKFPIRGKHWKLALPYEEFQALLASFQKRGFFRLYPNTGYRREITLHVHGKQRTVRSGEARYIGFETLERDLRKLATRAKIGLIFRDLFQRKDEDDVFSEGAIGQWAFRSLDALPPAKWSPTNHWRGMADLESVFSALRAMFRYLPTRTRLVSVDIQKEKVRTSTLLFGARILSRQTLEGLDRSQRLRGVKANGIGVIYLSMDKIEQAIFDARRLLIPQGTNASRRFAPKISLLSVLYKTLSSSDVQTLSLSWEKQPKKVPLCQLVKQPTPRKICRSFSLYRLSFQLKVRDHIALLKTLSSLAQHSRADRVLALRLNPSGFPDRARYSIILQAHLELLSPLQAPSPKHPFLSLPAHDKRPNPFLPIYP